MLLIFLKFPIFSPCFIVSSMSWPHRCASGSVFEHFDGAEDEGCGDVGPGGSKGDSVYVGLSRIPAGIMACWKMDHL